VGRGRRLTPPGRATGPPRPLAQIRAQHGLQIGEAAGDEPARTERVGRRRVQRVRQPLQPLPLAPDLGPDAGRDEEILRGVERGELADHRPREPTDHHAVGRWPGEHDPGERPHGDGDRQVRDGRVGVEEPAQRPRGHRLQVGGGVDHGRHQRRGQRLRTGADPNGAEVGVTRTALPQARAAGVAPQGGWFGVAVEHRLPLGRDRAPHPRAQARHVPQIVASGPHQLGLARSGRAAPVHGEHAEGGEPEDAADHVRVRAGAVPAAEHHRGGQGAGQHRQHGQQLLPPGAGRLRDRRRRLQRHLPARQRRCGPPGRPVHVIRVHGPRW
jgi:hypothetical protein